MASKPRTTLDGAVDAIPSLEVDCPAVSSEYNFNADALPSENEERRIGLQALRVVCDYMESSVTCELREARQSLLALMSDMESKHRDLVWFGNATPQEAESARGAIP